jgi:phosphoglycolate phosphatase
MKKHRCVIFDLDGTLADTLPDLVANVNRALAEKGFEGGTAQYFASKQGWSMEAQIEEMLPLEARNAATVDALAARTRRFYLEEPLNLARPYPGMTELLASLRQRKLKIAVLTNKPQTVAEIEVGRLFPGAFDRVSGIRAGEPFKPDPAAVWELLAELDRVPGDTILAGDSETDIKTAVASGCLPCGISWGYKPAAALVEAGARVIVNKPEEILELL